MRPLTVSPLSDEGIMDIERLHVGTTLSEAAIHAGTVYLAGQVADDRTLNIEGQTREILGHIDRLLAAAGTGVQVVTGWRR